jgi:hypothetical protein
MLVTANGNSTIICRELGAFPDNVLDTRRFTAVAIPRIFTEIIYQMH